MQQLTSFPEGAYFSTETGELYFGEGPFRSSAEPPASGTAFYVNDYELTDPQPWKEPSALHQVNTPQEIITTPACLEQATWTTPDSASFAEVFHEMLENIQEGILQKAVPVVTEHCDLGTGLDNCRRFLLYTFSRLQAPLHSYAWWNQNGGFSGATPEWLFYIENNQLSTMALAGTARREDAALFALDRKEIREHEYVVQSIMEKLSPYGKVTRSPRQTIDLKNLIHFHSPLTLILDKDASLNELIKRLHPTPALGPLPKNSETLALQHAWRRQLGCPPYFGAPFGLLHKDKFSCLVSIRGFFWENTTLYLPSGCGIIAESKLTHEWSELELKRHSVRKNLSL